jgi:DNA invertase Pin-like site-specific DNA recombinase
MKVCLYARVSMALKQDPQNQLIELRKWAKNASHEVVGEFIDEVSSKDTRPQKEVVLRKMRLGECDGVAFWALDRWGRTASELIFELEEFSKSGKAIISLKAGIDLSTSAGRLMANMLAIMANFERDRIKERTLLGLARARSQGKILGRHRLDCKCGQCRKKTPPADPIDSIKENSELNKRSFNYGN